MIGSASSSLEDDTDRLDFAKTGLHGREKEVQRLRDAFHRVQNTGKPEVILLRGGAGTGKSVLAESLRQVVPRGHFLSGKYNEIQSPQPFSAIVDALSPLCTSLSKSAGVGSLRNDLERKLGDDLLYLKPLMPSISTLVDIYSQNGDSNDNGWTTKEPSMERHNWAFERIKVAFRDFLRVLTKHSITITLFIDDLQWADESSLDLLQFVLTESRTKGLLFVCAYRDDEGDASSVRLGRIRTKTPFATTEIEVLPLTVDVVNSLIVNVTESDPETTVALASVVHAKTKGNAFFTIQLLTILHGEATIVRSEETGQWTWDVEKVRDDISTINSVAHLVSRQISRLSKDAVDLLKVASCFGSSFSFEVAATFVVNDRPGCDEEAVRKDLATALTLVMKEGLIVMQHNGEGTMHMFAHDKVQQGAYSFMEDEGERQWMHWRIGRLLQQLRQVPAVPESRLFLVFVDQLNRGCEMIEGSTDLLQLAELNWKAAKQVMSRASFAPARRFLMFGLSFLEDLNGWQDHYALHLDMRTTLAKVLYCVGEMEECEECCREVMQNAKRIEDKFRVYLVMIDALGSTLRWEDALAFGFQVLDELGESFPKRPTPSHVTMNFHKTAMKLKGRKDGELLGMPVMTSETKLFVLDVISSMITHCYPIDRTVEMGLLSMRLTQITLKFGLSKHTSRAFASWAYLQGTVFNFDEAHRFGKLASELAARFDDPANECRSLITSSCFVSHLRMPMADQLDGLLRAHQLGMESGDSSHASLASGYYTMMYFYCGLPLSRLLQDAKVFEEQQERYNQVVGRPLVVTVHQAALNLMGKAENPSKLTGAAMDQDEFIKSADANTRRIKVHTLWMVLKMVAYYFDDTKVAREMAENFYVHRTNTEGANFYMPSFLMFMSLISMEAWVETKKRKYKRYARANRRELEKWVEKDACNTNHKLKLLCAEQLAIDEPRKQELVKVRFDEAISMAKRSGLTHDLALANERAGKYFLKRGDVDKAFMYLRRAAVFYQEWEAKGKVEHLLRKYFLVQSTRVDASWLREAQVSTAADDSKGSGSKPSRYGLGLVPVDKPSFALESSLDRI